MKLHPLRLGYVPLTDAAPLIMAQELGFAAEEGLDLDLVQLGSWAQSRDYLAAGAVDAAHMLLPLPIAQRLGLGPAIPDLDLVMILSQGGQAIAISGPLAEAMRAAGHGFDFNDAWAAGASLRAAARKLRVGVPFAFSTHTELVWHWLLASGFVADEVEVRTVPPPRMAEALAAGEVDAACVGEPWASVAVETSAGVLLLPGRAIWASAPEKGLVLRHDFAEEQAELTGRLMRAVWRAGRWLDEADNRGTAAELLARPAYLDLTSELTERGLSGRFVISPAGELRAAPAFIRFHAGAATFPWRSIAAFLGDRMARRFGLAPDTAIDRATASFRTDLYRRHLRDAGADLPGASAKIEGAMQHPHAVASESGRMILYPDAFFDGHIFDPASQLR